jgi:hypothetical protein
MPEASNDYEIGYRKPPAGTRFTKGCSGNPKGRPKGSRSLETVFNEVIRERVSLTEGGRTRKVSKLEAILRQLLAKALTGDMRAIKELIALKQLFDTVADPSAGENPDNEKNHAVMQSFLERMRSMTAEPTDIDQPKGDEPR